MKKQLKNWQNIKFYQKELNMQKFDICIIGAGASGSMLAIEMAKNGNSVCLFDANEKPAKKLLVTGNGRCNLTNKNMASQFYNQKIDGFLSCFGYLDTEKKFKSYGLDIYYDDCGRAYPLSNSAKTVQFVLDEQIQQSKVKFINAQVLDVEKISNQYKVLASNNNEVLCDKVVFACGLNEFSLAIFKKFDIECNELVPTLVALKTKQNTKILEGQRLSDVLVTANCNGKTKSEIGEILFKEHGLSGICIFNLSSLFAKNKAFFGKISINLLPKLQKNQIIQKLSEKMSIFKNAHKTLLSMFSKELSLEILRRACIEKSKTNLNNQELEQIANIIANLDFDIVGAYSNNQVVSGGVKLEVLTDDLESKNNKNMFCCGEICDVDGVCGGYNLQWAWTSANVVAKRLKMC